MSAYKITLGNLLIALSWGSPCKLPGGTPNISFPIAACGVFDRVHVLHGERANQTKLDMLEQATAGQYNKKSAFLAERLTISYQLAGIAYSLYMII